MQKFDLNFSLPSPLKHTNICFKKNHSEKFSYVELDHGGDYQWVTCTGRYDLYAKTYSQASPATPSDETAA